MSKPCRRREPYSRPDDVLRRSAMWQRRLCALVLRSCDV